ncbi:MAG TPA: aminotransferase class V-fold PLP-dependent enzyme [Pirellulales bacterium]|nr:aminotransferase class V-fold PLP-dependent enzyme [Pirellulales bacterium]
MGSTAATLEDRFRAQMPVAERWAYFDHAAVAPLPRAARDIFAAWIDEVAQHGDAHWPQWAAGLERVRSSAARLLTADTAEIAFVRSTTEGITLVAEGFPWTPGDNVVTLADEFPSNLYPWMNLASRGVETRRVATKLGRYELADLAAACDAQTRILSISWVNYATGWRNDLDAIVDLAHRRGVLVFVDAIQGLGVLPIDLSRTNVDFLAADGHKWLIGPEGAGLLFVRRKHLDLLRPIGVGWNSVVHAHDFSRIELQLKASASRYEGGTQNIGSILALGASIDLLLSLNIARVGSRVLEYSARCCDRLATIGARIVSVRSPEQASGIVTFGRQGRDPAEVRRRCLDARVVLSCRGGRLRISPHAYNNEDDLDRLVDVINTS